MLKAIAAAWAGSILTSLCDPLAILVVLPFRTSAPTIQNNAAMEIIHGFFVARHVDLEWTSAENVRCGFIVASYQAYHYLPTHI